MGLMVVVWGLGSILIVFNCRLLKRMQELHINADYSKSKRQSMVDLQSETKELFGSAPKIRRHKRNSSIEGKSK